MIPNISAKVNTTSFSDIIFSINVSSSQMPTISADKSTTKTTIISILRLAPYASSEKIDEF